MELKTTMVTNRSFVFSASKFLGLFPTGAKPPTKVRAVGLVLTSLIIVLMVVQLNYLISTSHSNYPYEPFMSLVWRFYTIVSLLMMAAIFIEHFRKMSLTDYFEFVVEESKPDIRSKITSLVFVIITSIKTAVFASKMLQKYYYTENFKSVATFASYTAQSVCEILLYLIVSQMCAMVNVITTLLEIAKTSRGSAVSKMSRLHDGLEMSAAVNRLYERQILFTVVYFVIFLINRIYHAMMQLFNKRAIDVEQLGFHILTVCGLCIPLVLPLGPCEKLKKTVDAFYDDLYNEMKQSELLRKNNKLRLYLYLRRNVNFSACGFFSLGYSLITSVMAAITTYAVILVQFSIKEPRLVVNKTTLHHDSIVDILEG